EDTLSPPLQAFLEHAALALDLGPQNSRPHPVGLPLPGGIPRRVNADARGPGCGREMHRARIVPDMDRAALEGRSARPDGENAGGVVPPPPSLDQVLARVEIR